MPIPFPCPTDQIGYDFQNVVRIDDMDDLMFSGTATDILNVSEATCVTPGSSFGSNRSCKLIEISEAIQSVSREKKRVINLSLF